MLKSIRIALTGHRQALLQSFKTLMDTPFATFMTLTVIAVALTLPALFWLLSTNIKQLTTSWQQGEHIALYLQVGLSEGDQQQLLKKIRTTQGVANAVLISPQEALRSLQQQEGLQDVNQYLTENPLPAVIDVTPEESFNQPETLNTLFQHLSAYPHVEQAKLDMQWVSRLYAILSFVTALAKAFMILLGFAVIMIIGNTLRLAIHKHYNEVKVLKLIGATNAYIARPFLYSGLWFGFLGAILALVLVYIFLWSLTAAFHEVLVLYHLQSMQIIFSWQACIALILIAMTLGWLGARLSIGRQLALIEP